MKKKTIVILLLIVVGLLIYCVFFNSHIFSAIRSPYSDTLLIKRHHVLSSSGADLRRLASEGLFLPELQRSLCGLSLRLPSLNERPGEIPVLASVFISQYNMEFTKQVIGFESEALEYLKAYRWTANLEQLRDIIRQLVITAGKSYISLSDVQSVLTDSIGHKDVSPDIDLSKTLAEIEMEIISRVLAEEDMNQSRAAKRLGIGRSTLWRKLADIEAR